jgi:hypothetical protein
MRLPVLCAALGLALTAGCGKSGVDPGESRLKTAFALAQIYEAKSLATVPEPPSGDDIRSFCNPQPPGERHPHEWFCVANRTSSSGIVQNVEGASNRLIWDASRHAFRFAGSGVVGQTFAAGTLPLAAVLKVEQADGNELGGANDSSPYAMATAADAAHLAGALSGSQAASPTTSTPERPPATTTETQSVGSPPPHAPARTLTAPQAGPCHDAGQVETSELESAAKAKFHEVEQLTHGKVCGEWAGATWPAAQPQRIVFRQSYGKWRALTYGTALDEPGHEEYPRAIIGLY